MLATLTNRWGDLMVALWQHIQLTVFSLVIASLIAIPIAIWSLRHRRFAESILQITGVLQTIPSLAILAIMIPIVGIGFPSALVALVVYALLPIFQNTYLGLTQVESELVASAQALGLPKRKILTKIQLPLATPAIVAGLRTATVMIVGTGTLAALIGAGGLGTFILLGIDRGNNNLLLIGAISSAILAIVATLFITFIGRIKAAGRWLLGGGAVVAVVGFTVLPPVLTPQTTTVTIAGKLGSEPSILIAMYRDLIKQADPHAKVVLKDNFGKTSFLFDALKSGDIDIYPEFTGTVLSDLAPKPVKLPAGADGQATYQAAEKVVKKLNLRMSQPAKFNDTYALAVRDADAEQYGLKTIGDLAKLPNAKGGMTDEFLDRPDGWPGIEKTYGLSMPTTSFDPNLRYIAIDKHKVSVVDAYSTDSQITQYHLRVLEDNKHFFPAYQAVPLMKNSFAKAHPEYVRALNKLHNKISTQDMQKMNYLVNSKHESSDKVAHDYLVKHDLLTK